MTAYVFTNLKGFRFIDRNLRKHFVVQLNITLKCKIHFKYKAA